VVSDNSITYQDDKRNSSWTVGYYLGSAQMRLDKIHELMDESPELHLKAPTLGLLIVETWDLNAEQTLLEWYHVHNTIIRIFKIVNPDSPLTERGAPINGRV
jgi:hypothetical protein